MKRESSLRLVISAVLTGVLAGCGGPAIRSIGQLPLLSPSEPELAERLEPDDTGESSFAPLDSKPIRKGDRLAYGIELKSESRNERWRLDFEVLTEAVPPGQKLCFEELTMEAPAWRKRWQTGSALIRARLFSQDQELMAEHIQAMPVEYLQLGGMGFLRFLKFSSENLVRDVNLSEIELPPGFLSSLYGELITFGDAFDAVVVLLKETLEGAPDLLPAGRSLIAIPWLTIPFQGVHVELSFGDQPNVVEDLRRLPGVPVDAPVLRIPASVVINGRIALQLELAFMDSLGAQQVTGGLVALEAANPTNPKNRLSVRLVESVRGPNEGSCQDVEVVSNR